MAAITLPRFDETSESDVVRGAGARAAAARTRDLVGRGRERAPGRGSAASPSLFSGDGRLRPAPPVRLTSVPLVAHDDLAPRAGARVGARRTGAVAVRPIAAVAEPVRTARPAVGPATAGRRPSAATFRRRRRTVAALFLGALLAGSWVLGALGGGSLAASERGSSSTVELEVQPVRRSTQVVGPGDTLWSIARALQPEGDVRPIVDALAADRQGRPLEVGETIVLP